jgi:ribonucleoside-diphosphate reductase alpha chain
MPTEGHTDHRRRLPETRRSWTHKGKHGNQEYYIILSCFDDGCEPAEIFVRVAKEGTDLAGWVNVWALTLSVALQYGVPWDVIREKYLHQRFGQDDAVRNSPSLIHSLVSDLDTLIGALRAWSAAPEAQRDEDNRVVLVRDTFGGRAATTEVL